MQRILSRAFIALAGGMAVSGCLIETLQEEPVIDLTAVTGTGTAIDPYVLPATMPTNTDGGINDYITAVATPGYWQFNYNSKQVDFGVAPGFGSLLYNSTTDVWRLTVAGTDYDYIGTGTSETCVTDCVKLTRFGTAAADYGSFAFALYDDMAGNYSFAAMYYGMLTNNPQTTGTGTYNGSLVGAAYQVTLDSATATTSVEHVYTASGSIKIEADFDTTSFTLATTTDGTLVDAIGSGAPDGSFSLSGSGTITGNTYSGTTAATLTMTEITSIPDGLGGFIPQANTVADTSYTGTIAGGFYGPSGVETVGAVEATSTATPTNTFAGAYWAERKVVVGF